MQMGNHSTDRAFTCPSALQVVLAVVVPGVLLCKKKDFSELTRASKRLLMPRQSVAVSPGVAQEACHTWKRVGFRIWRQ